MFDELKEFTEDDRFRKARLLAQDLCKSIECRFDYEAVEVSEGAKVRKVPGGYMVAAEVFVDTDAVFWSKL